METSLEIVVRPTEVDVNGHVNNAKYVEYMEWGREEWYEKHGLPYDRLLALGAVTVTVNLNLNFRQECRQGEVLTIVTRPERLGRTSFVLRQEIRKRDGAVAADGTDHDGHDRPGQPEEPARPGRAGGGLPGRDHGRTVPVGAPNAETHARAQSSIA